VRLGLAALLIASFASAATNARVRELRRNAAGKQAVIGSTAGAAGSHIRNSPHEWGRGPGGFVKRVGSSLGQHVAKESIQFGVAAAHHENLRYRRSNKRRVLPRMGYAVKHTFIVPKTNRPGRKTVALGRVSGNLGAGMISRAWQPASAAGVGAGLASGGIGLGADVGVNMAREFWPRRRARRARRVTASSVRPASRPRRARDR
jgi:hypothetical protein